jgi:hypothetical protein
MFSLIYFDVIDYKMKNALEVAQFETMKECLDKIALDSPSYHRIEKLITTGRKLVFSSPIPEKPKPQPVQPTPEPIPEPEPISEPEQPIEN